MRTGARPQARGLLFAVLAAGLGALIAAAPAAIALVAPSLVGIMGLVVLVRVLASAWGDAVDGQRVLLWTMALFFSHLLVGLVVTALSTPLAFLRSDALTYHSGASVILQHWAGEMPMPVLAGGKEGYYFTLAGLYWIFGTHAVAGLVFNAAVTAALVPLLTDVTLRMFGPSAAERVPPLLLFIPGVMLWTAPLLKEGPIAFLVAVAAFCAVRIAHRLTIASALGFAASLAILFTYRGPIAFVISGGLVIAIIGSSRQLFTGLGLAAVVGSALAMVVLALGVGLSGYRSATESDLERVNIVRQDLARSANSGLQPGVDVSTPSRALSYLPIGLTNVLLGPFPWQIKTLNQVPALVDVAVWWALLPSLVRAIRAARRTGREYLVLVVPAGLALVVLGLAVGNFGTIVRERVQVLVLLIPLISFGLALRRKHSAAITREMASTSAAAPVTLAAAPRS